jgi:hypothetical protein
MEALGGRGGIAPTHSYIYLFIYVFMLPPFAFHLLLPNVVFEWLSLLIRIREVPGLARRQAVLWVFVVFPQFFQTGDSTIKLGHVRFVPYPTQFSIHFSHVHPTLYNLSHWRSVVKWTANIFSYRVRFHALTEASVKLKVFWDMLLCGQVDVDRRFRGACCPDDGGSTNLWNVCRHGFDYTAV